MPKPTDTINGGTKDIDDICDLFLKQIEPMLKHLRTRVFGHPLEAERTHEALVAIAAELKIMNYQNRLHLILNAGMLANNYNLREEVKASRMGGVPNKIYDTWKTILVSVLTSHGQAFDDPANEKPPA